LLYGDTSPYARTVEYATIDNIDRDDAIAFYKTYFQPDRAILGLVGDFDPAEMQQKVVEAFGDWQATESERAALPTPPAAQQATLGGLFLVEMPQLTQSYVQIGHLGGQFDSPDYPALSVLNEVLNGFGGRLFNKVRSELGLAYSVYGFWRARFDYDGTFLAGGQTQSETTVPFVDAVRAEIDRLRAEPVDPQELTNAKEAILNSFVFNFQDPSQTLSRLMRYEYYGYPADFIFRYQQGVKATTAADIQRVAQEYLQPEKLVTLVVGNPNEIQPPLSALSDRVTTVDITIPEPTAIAN
ncbi:MAG: pitrilysin family protein, partial [Cyanobacteria bacterium J06641_5]